MKKAIQNILPDIINASPDKNFSQISNEVLRCPNLSFKAKGILCLLLSNKEGWKSHIITLKNQSTNGLDSIRSGLMELQKNGYLFRNRYRCCKTKKIKGTLWYVTDIPNVFGNIEEINKKCKENHLEWHPENPGGGNPDMGFPDMGNPTLIILNNKNNKNNNFLKEKNPENSLNLSNQNKTPDPLIKKDKKITPSMFEQFWKIYPNKKSKYKAEMAFIKATKLPAQILPTKKLILCMIKKHSRTEQWKSGTIPNFATWFNQKRWNKSIEEINDDWKYVLKNKEEENKSIPPRPKHPEPEPGEQYRGDWHIDNAQHEWDMKYEPGYKEKWESQNY